MGLQQTLKALADPIRREILNLLKKGRMPAGEITAHFSVSAPAISRAAFLASGKVIKTPLFSFIAHCSIALPKTKVDVTKIVTST